MSEMIIAEIMKTEYLNYRDFKKIIWPNMIVIKF